MIKQLATLLSILFMLSLVSCNNEIYNTTSISTKDYTPSINGYPVGRVIDVNTSSTSLEQKSKQLLFYL